MGLILRPEQASDSVARRINLLNIFACAFFAGAETFTALSSGAINAMLHGATLENFLVGAVIGLVPIPAALGVLKRLSI